MIDKNNRITQAEFGKLIGVSQAAVSDLITRSVIEKGEPCGVWLTKYCAHLREIAAGRASGGSLELSEERARLASEQADRVAMQNAERRGELAPVADMELVLAMVGSKVGRILDTIPAMVRRRVPDAGAEVIDAVATDIAKCRNMAASMTLASLAQDEEEQQDEEVIDA